MGKRIFLRIDYNEICVARLTIKGEYLRAIANDNIQFNVTCSILPRRNMNVNRVNDDNINSFKKYLGTTDDTESQLMAFDEILSRFRKAYIKKLKNKQR